jgi:hypothetical protein
MGAVVKNSMNALYRRMPRCAVSSRAASTEIDRVVAPLPKVKGGDHNRNLLTPRIISMQRKRGRDLNMQLIVETPNGLRTFCRNES